MQSGGGALSPGQVFVKDLHHLERTGVVKVPESSHHVPCSSSHKRPGQSNGTLAINSSFGAEAGRNSDQVCVQFSFDDISPIELVQILGLRRQNDSRLQRVDLIRCAVGGKMDPMKSLRMALWVGRWNCGFTCHNHFLSG